jgi:hypothetical protein
MLCLPSDMQVVSKVTIQEPQELSVQEPTDEMSDLCQSSQRRSGRIRVRHRRRISNYTSFTQFVGGCLVCKVSKFAPILDLLRPARLHATAQQPTTGEHESMSPFFGDTIGNQPPRKPDRRFDSVGPRRLPETTFSVTPCVARIASDAAHRSEIRTRVPSE